MGELITKEAADLMSKEDIVAAANQVERQRANLQARVSELSGRETALDELVEYVNPVSRDLGFEGGLRTIRHTVEDERAWISRLNSIIGEAATLGKRLIASESTWVRDQDARLSEVEAFLATIPDELQ